MEVPLWQKIRRLRWPPRHCRLPVASRLVESCDRTRVCVCRGIPPTPSHTCRFLLQTRLHIFGTKVKVTEAKLILILETKDAVESQTVGCGRETLAWETYKTHAQHMKRGRNEKVVRQAGKKCEATLGQCSRVGQSSNSYLSETESDTLSSAARSATSRRPRDPFSARNQEETDIKFCDIV